MVNEVSVLRSLHSQVVRVKFTVESNSKIHIVISRVSTNRIIEDTKLAGLQWRREWAK